jgi:hypothetical protein
LIESRAIEAVIWGMLAVNTELMRQEMLKADGKENQIIYWDKPLDWHNQTLTPNPGLDCNTINEKGTRFGPFLCNLDLLIMLGALLLGLPR